MKAIVKKEYKDEILNAALAGKRFNLKGGGYDPVSEIDYSSGELSSVLLKVALSVGELFVYKINKADILFLNGENGVLHRSNYYSLFGEAVTEENIKRLSRYEGGEPWRGSIMIECDAHEPAIKEFVKQCYNPGYIFGLKYVMSSGALTKAKKLSKDQKNRGDKVILVVGECGLNDFALYFTETKTLEEILGYAFENANFSAQFLKSYCESE